MREGMELGMRVVLLGFPGGAAVNNLPAVQEPQEMWIRSLGREDPMEEGKATHSIILARRIPWTEEPGGLQSIGSKELDMTAVTLHACMHVVLLESQCPEPERIQERIYACSL